MAHKKGQGSSRNGRDSNSQRLGIKLYGGQYARVGSIICRQRGTRWRPGKYVGVGKDWTIYARVEGHVYFDQKGRRINIQPLEPVGVASTNGHSEPSTAPEPTNPEPAPVASDPEVATSEA